MEEESEDDDVVHAAAAKARSLDIGSKTVADIEVSENYRITAHSSLLSSQL